MLTLSHWWIYPIVWIPNIYLKLLSISSLGTLWIIFYGHMHEYLMPDKLFSLGYFWGAEKAVPERGHNFRFSRNCETSPKRLWQLLSHIYMSLCFSAAASHPHEQLVFSVLKFKAFWWGLICLTLTIRQVSIWTHLLAIGKSSVAYTVNKWPTVYRSSLYILFLCLLLNISITIITSHSLDRIFIHLLESLLW